MAICKYCGEPAAYKNVNQCKKCHSLYGKENYKAQKERTERWRKEQGRAEYGHKEGVKT
jgi:hypothetical protein